MSHPTKLDLLTTALCLAGLLPVARADSAAPLTGQRTLNLVYVHDWQAQPERQRLVALPGTRGTLNNAGELVAFDESGPTLWPGKVFDAGNDGVLAWGRWTRDTIGGSGALAGHSITGAEGVRNSFRYLAGVAAPLNAITAMKSAGGSATFSLAGGSTGPTAGEGGGVSITLLTGGTLTLPPGGDELALELRFRVASGIYTLTANDIPINGEWFASVQPIPTTGVLCITPCTARVSGFFAGEQAQRAGLAFSVHNPALDKHINGIAVFARD